MKKHWPPQMDKSNSFEKGYIWYAEEVVISEWRRLLTSADKLIITDLISIVSSPTSAREQPQLNHPPSAASALFRRFFHLVYITLESIWSVVTQELSARRPDSGCLCAPHHHRDESSGDAILSSFRPKDVTTAWRKHADTWRRTDSSKNNIWRKN